MIEPVGQVPPPGNRVDILALVMDSVTLSPQNVAWALMPLGKNMLVISINIKSLNSVGALERWSVGALN